MLRLVKHPTSLSSKPSSTLLTLLLHKPTPSNRPVHTSKTPPVAIFWDLDNKPPNTIPPYDAAVRIKLAASAFGPVKFTVAYANHHAFRHVPAPIRAQRQRRNALDRLENSGATAHSEPYLCRVCGRNFYNHTRFVNHFKQIHEKEHIKRQNRLESAKGGQRVKLVGRFSMKMEKYKRAAREVLVPKVGYGLADELNRAGVWVGTVEDKPEAADRALREHMLQVMDRGRIGCLMLVSDDTGFTGVLREARMRCLKTVVVGDDGDGALKRCADAGFSWKEVVSGKAKKAAESTLGRWRDRELLKKLEWTYVEESEARESDEFEGESEDGDDGDWSLGLIGKKGSEPWWKLEPESGGDSHKGSSK